MSAVRQRLSQPSLYDIPYKVARYATLGTWDRCYDFKNIFAKKIGEKFAVFDSKHC
jgi:hypothetical protein